MSIKSRQTCGNSGVGSSLTGAVNIKMHNPRIASAKDFLAGSFVFDI
jgi:hypothetical protein